MKVAVIARLEMEIHEATPGLAEETASKSVTEALNAVKSAEGTFVKAEAKVTRRRLRSSDAPIKVETYATLRMEVAEPKPNLAEDAAIEEVLSALKVVKAKYTSVVSQHVTSPDDEIDDSYKNLTSWQPGYITTSNGEIIKVDYQGTSEVAFLMLRMDGENGVYHSEESLYLADCPELIEKIMAGETIEL